MKYREEYQRKLVSAETAAAVVKSGDWVDYGHFACAPTFLDAALAQRVHELHDVKIRALTFPGMAAVATADPLQEHFVYNNWHFGGGDRMLHDKGLCSYIPLLYHEGPTLYGLIDSDVFMVKTAPMDGGGYFNFGPSNSISKHIADRAKTVIVEVNANVPYCYGGLNEAVHISEVDYIVESDNKPLVQTKEPLVSDVDRDIARLIVQEIPDGACLQLGIGAMPNAVGKLIAESDLKDLGVHTEMLVDSYVNMYEAGRITNMRKQRDRGRMVYTFALGTQRLYDFIDHNARCASYSVDYTNNPEHIRTNDNMIAINNAVEVDLYGQVSSESSGTRQISGTGGQFDYIFGAFHSRGGKSFICLSSTKTDRNGTVRSRIRPMLDPGSIVTVPRTIVHYVVTEYGKAMLKGKSTWERAEALIGISHPAFRDELVEEAERMGIWRRSQRLAA
ncbi:MAG TPA: acetyl-CoA hydrolase/transferase C-terminal domain-containing protein [Deltaproteobacteria bacterium]|nr:acetyl-CoA hydrolase/transferase C-terminal domain-containing protein [Deltaproteobacteria bacterium]HPR54899.1 acetyl-CoA hydrolase/transferase C-terminal domain-containing protein [Deltaproteobacteria bacterium]HXK48222.1 acetyl-CoA hydrolase/transferase C-terminal domain-containing protein [Deltaproteobacteria bacterium]